MFALRFISGKYQGSEYRLRPGRPVVIGRSSGLDVVLAEDMVSRKHARFHLQDEGVTVEDLGSTNGTFVNGEKVRRARLKEGDRILIGMSILKLVCRPDEATEAAGSLPDWQGEPAAQPRSAMNGSIDDVQLPDLLQLFATSKKSGVLRVLADAHEARLYLRQGRVYYAVIDERHELGPHKSFTRVLRWTRGQFELLPAESREFMVEMEASTEALLMEGMRQIDELRRLEPHLPPPSAALCVSRPLKARLRELPRDQLEVLQLAHDTGTVQGVLDGYEGPDLEAARALASLLRRGALIAS